MGMCVHRVSGIATLQSCQMSIVKPLSFLRAFITLWLGGRNVIKGETQMAQNGRMYTYSVRKRNYMQ